MANPSKPTGPQVKREDTAKASATTSKDAQDDARRRMEASTAREGRDPAHDPARSKAVEGDPTRDQARAQEDARAAAAAASKAPGDPGFRDPAGGPEDAVSRTVRPGGAAPHDMATVTVGVDPRAQATARITSSVGEEKTVPGGGAEKITLSRGGSVTVTFG